VPKFLPNRRRWGTIAVVRGLEKECVVSVGIRAEACLILVTWKLEPTLFEEEASDYTHFSQLTGLRKESGQCLIRLLNGCFAFIPDAEALFRRNQRNKKLEREGKESRELHMV